MVLETPVIPFAEWIRDAIPFFFLAAGLLGLFAIAVGYLISAFRYGPMVGGDVAFRVLRSGFWDLVRISPRRIGALAYLAIQESIRRKVLVGFLIFLLILLFAGWFLDTQSNDPGTLYLSFVLTATGYLSLLMALFLSAFSLPSDFKSKTIYTVVTKPVRPSEIVLGRIAGFVALGTVLLAVMALCSYFFVVRILDHAHEVQAESLKAVPGSTDQVGRTTSAQNHFHQFTINADGQGITDTRQGHRHSIEKQTRDGKTAYVVGPPEGRLVARVPKYGTLRFRDRQGQQIERGISVGAEWKYRSYVEGGSLMAAIWTFDNVTKENYPDGLPLEMTVRVFRSHKGNIERGIAGSITVKNPADPNKGKNSEKKYVDNFEAKDTYIDRHDIPWTTGSGENARDLFSELVSPDGKVEVWLECLEPGQYFGVAQADMYLHARDAAFFPNFVKGYIGIWLQMVLVTSFGVMFSTFLSGPVAMLATMTSLVMGFFTKFVLDVASGDIQGGGPVESIVRIVKQMNVVSPLEEGLSTTVIKSVDQVLMALMTGIVSLLPDYSKFSFENFVAYGFNIPADLVLEQLVAGVAYLVPVFIIGYFFLKTREVAR
jgi:hypothetical protein